MMACATLNKDKQHSASIQYMPANPLGRDFVVGDLHGHPDSLMRLLDTVKFDESKDRVFSVGDLVDRGPDSLKCLLLCKQSWFYAVLGNHEDVLVRCLKILAKAASKKMGIKSLGRNDLKWLLYYVERLGGHWFLGLDHDQLESLSFIENLPIVLSVGDGERRFNVVHAQFDKVNGKVITDIGIDQLAKNGMSANTRATCLWGRSLIKRCENKRTIRKGLSTAFCGHTPIKQPLIHSSHFFIDTGGCFQDGKFTMIDASTHQIFQVVASRHHH